MIYHLLELKTTLNLYKGNIVWLEILVVVIYDEILGDVILAMCTESSVTASMKFRIQVLNVDTWQIIFGDTWLISPTTNLFPHQY